MSVHRFTSQKFRFYSFVCIALLLFVHGYNLNETYLQPFSMVKEPLTFTTFFEYFISNGILRFRIPLLFIISGYFFAMQDSRPYLQRIKKRFASLMIPFFIWSALGLLFTIWLEQYDITAQAVRLAELDQMGDRRPYSTMAWDDLLFRWLVAPVSFQLWFLRSLFLYNLFYPIIKWLVTKIPAVWFVIALLFWLIGFRILFMEGQGLLFFSFGVWLFKSNYPLHQTPKWFSHYLSWLFFIGLSVIKTFMAFELEMDTMPSYRIITVLHCSAVFAGVFAVWFGADAIVKWCMSKKWFVWASAFSFFIFGLHVPLLAYLTRFVYMYCSQIPNYRLLTYLIVPSFVLLFCISVGALVRSLFPKVYRVMTGGRGI
jgi:fucose 4-O-acetylase-like acetyltransferase